MSIYLGKLGIKDNGGSGLVAGNPFEALLPEDRLRKLQSFPDEQRQEYYGKVMESIFSDPEYQNIAGNAARREFDKMNGKGGDDDLRGMIADVVEDVLNKRGR